MRNSYSANKCLLSIIAGILISLNVNAQDVAVTDASSPASGWLLGISVSPDYGFRTLKNEDGSSISKFIFEWRDKNEVPGFGYTAGLNICRKFSRRLGIEAGIQYSNKCFSTRKTDAIYGDMIDPRYGFVYQTVSVPPAENYKTRYNYIYLDIPVRALYILGKKRLHFITGIGVTASIFLQARHTFILEYSDGDISRKSQKQKDKYRSVCFTPSLSTGIGYEVRKKFLLRVEPTFRYGLTKIIDAPVTSRLWSVGLNVSCYYKLK